MDWVWRCSLLSVSTMLRSFFFCKSPIGSRWRRSPRPLAGKIVWTAHSITSDGYFSVTGYLLIVVYPTLSRHASHHLEYSRMSALHAIEQCLFILEVYLLKCCICFCKYLGKNYKKMLIPNYSKSCALRWLTSTVIFTINALHKYNPHNSYSYR